MEFLQPTSWDEALDLKAEHPAAMPIAGGTDAIRAATGLDLRRVPVRPEHITGT